MKASSRPRDVGGSFGSRRGHAGQLSISDTNHHVTEAIGDMYGDDEYSRRESRPLSYLTSPLLAPEEERESFNDASKSFANRAQNRPPPSTNGYNNDRAYTTPSRMPSQTRNNMYDSTRVQRSSSLDQGPLSPTRSFREAGGMDPNAPHSLPLQDIDYESSPAAVAQELSNLQALRRMSMDVGSASDPDLPAFGNKSFIPSIAPKSGDDNDPSRLFWVPAAVHPELAPMEFKTFIEKQVQTIKRRSGDGTLLPTDGVERSGSNGGGLRRKKSMLSRQIDNSGGRGAINYHDGSEQLERKRSQGQRPEVTIAGLQELDELVKDPKALANGMETLKEVDEDMPILPAAPGLGLRRSTHTTYRKGGSLKKGERLPYSKRIGSRTADVDGAQAPPGHGLSRVQSEPITENFSRPGRGGRRGGAMPMAGPGHSQAVVQDELSIPTHQAHEAEQVLPVRTSSMNDRAPRIETPIPQILETPPIEEQQQSRPYNQYQYPDRTVSQTPPTPAPASALPPAPVPAPAPVQAPAPVPQSQAQVQPQTQLQSQQPRADDQPSRLTKRRGRSPSQASSASQASSQSAPGQQQGRPAQTFNDMAQNPQMIPGNNSRTDALTFIPTVNEGSSKLEKKKKDDKSGKKGGWGWFKGSEEKEAKAKEEEAKRNRNRAASERAHDARLDVLNTTIDPAASRGRESLVMDRDSIDSKLLDERKKDSSRRSASDGKKEKDGLFSSLFGGSKKKGDKESGHKKGNSLRAISPEPTVYRPLRPDIDYAWTRFSLLEERAIYRMAHMKLANPRRALASQVLLSNFMYSYLAKVQQMHPNVQVPQSAQQKKLQQQQREEAERKQRELEQQQQQQQQMYADQQEEGYKYDYHQGIAQYAEQGSDPGSYVDDSQIYDYEHQDEEQRRQQGAGRPQSRASSHDSDGRNGNHQYGRNDRQDEYYSNMYNQGGQQYHNEGSDMW